MSMEARREDTCLRKRYQTEMRVTSASVRFAVAADSSRNPSKSRRGVLTRASPKPVTPPKKAATVTAPPSELERIPL